MFLKIDAFEGAKPHSPLMCVVVEIVFLLFDMKICIFVGKKYNS